jgi:hypothetical protein
MNNIEYFSHPDGNYALIHDTNQRKSLCFQKTMIDEQFIIIKLESQTPLTQKEYNYYVGGEDNSYCDNGVFFVPNNQVEAVKIQINKIIEDWKNNNSKYIDSIEEGMCYIALRYTPSGMWVLTYDITNNLAFFENSLKMFDSFNPVITHIEAGLVCNPNTFYATQSAEECGGEDFIGGLKREKDPIVKLMKSEGLIK